MGLFSKIKSVAKKTQSTVRDTVEKATAKTPLAGAVRSVTRASVKDPASLLKAAKTIGGAVAAVQSGGMSAIAISTGKSAINSALNSKSVKDAATNAKQAAAASAARSLTATSKAISTSKTPLKTTQNAMAEKTSTSSLVKIAKPTTARKRKSEMTKAEWKAYAGEKKTVGGLL